MLAMKRGIFVKKCLEKLFGGLDITWPKLIIFAVICGVYTGAMAVIPATADTSFRDIAISFEWWILFAIVIIVNSKTPLDSALKVFVFFLISQPLVYLVEVPFVADGFGIFRYYPAWFEWTLLTFPMAFVGHYMKKDKWWGLLILAPMMVFLGGHYTGFIGEAVHFFPNHLLSAIFCAATLIIYPLFIFKNKKIRTAGLILSIVIIAVASVVGVLDERSSSYDTSLLLSGGETCGVEYDETWQVYLQDERFGDVRIGYEESIESYLIYASFKKTGQTVLVLESPEGETYEYDLSVERSSYDVVRKTP